MKHCEYCNIDVRGKAVVCPLCGRKLSGSLQNTEPVYPSYHSAETVKEERRGMAGKMLAVTVFILCSAVVMDLLTHTAAGGYWCMDIAAILGYLWVLVLHTVRSTARGFVKLLVQACMVSLLLVVFDLNAGGGLWSVSFAIPIQATAMICLATYIVLSKKMSWREYLCYGIADLCLGFAPMIAVQMRIVHMAWPFFLCASCAVVTFFLMLLCAERNYKEEETRRFRF
jgi:hypothetical protein